MLSTQCPDVRVTKYCRLVSTVQCGHFTRKQRWCEWEAAYEESLRRAAISMNEAELAAVSQHSHQPHVQRYPG